MFENISPYKHFSHEKAAKISLHAPFYQVTLLPSDLYYLEEAKEKIHSYSTLEMI